MNAIKISKDIVSSLPSGSYGIFHPKTDSLVEVLHVSTLDTLETLFPIHGDIMHRHELFEYDEYKKEMDYHLNDCTFEDCYLVNVAEIKLWKAVGE